MRSTANFKLYVSYHSYGQYILYPWGYDKAVPPDHADLDRVGKKAAQVSIKLYRFKPIKNTIHFRK